MNEGPFRMPKQVDRGATSKSEETRPVEEKHHVSEAPRPVHRAASSRRHVEEEKSLKRFMLPAFGVLAAVVVLVGGWFAVSSFQNPAMPIDSNKYQAVTITDGQIYFGKLSVVNDQYVKLTNAYYLQAQPPKDAADTETETQSTEQSDVKLIKLANKIYGPENEIVIAKSQIVAYENLKSDGQVAEWLKENADK